MYYTDAHSDEKDARVSFSSECKEVFNGFFYES